MALFISNRIPGTKHTHSNQDPKYTPVCPFPCSLSCIHEPPRCLAVHFTTNSNFLHALAINKKINGAFFPLRLVKTNQLRPIYCNKDASALDEAEEMLRTSVIRFSSEAKRLSADKARVFVFIE